MPAALPRALLPRSTSLLEQRLQNPGKISIHGFSQALRSIGGAWCRVTKYALCIVSYEDAMAYSQG
jgi:hypothetical protein